MTEFSDQAESIFIGFVKYFIVFCFGVASGYYWAMKSFNVLGG